MSGRTRYIDAEPACVGADTVVELLESIGWERSSRLIRDMGERSQYANLEAERWRKRYAELKERYEPAEPRLPPVNHQPPPEASD